MKEFGGGVPINARIKIDYNKNKPKVSFSYPSKNNQVRGNFFPFLFLILLLTFFLVYKGIMLEKGMEQFKLMNNTNTTFAKQTLDDFTKTFSPYYKDPSLFWLFILPISLSLIIYYPLRKRIWNKVYPDFMAKITRKKLAILTNKDVKINENGIYCEIPVFDNIILDYKASEDFSRYMNLFEIKEHKLIFYHKKPKRITKRKLKSWKKKTINEWIWYARFYFKQKPINGKLEVLFK